MPAIAEVNLKQGTCRRWAVRPSAEESFLRSIDLPPCPSEAPSRCILRGAHELPCGTDLIGAVRSLVDVEDPESWPPTVTARPFDYAGPIAEVNDYAAEVDLLATDSPSPLWDQIRDFASECQVGVIHLMQLHRLIVPVLALRASGGTLEWVPNCGESVFLPQLALLDDEDQV